MQTKYFSARNIANGIMVILLLTALLIMTSEKVGAKSEPEMLSLRAYNYTCDDPLTFSHIKELGNCTKLPYGDDGIQMGENSPETEQETTPVLTATPSPEVTATAEPTAEPTQEPTETPACETKNKNDDKKPGENPCDGNAGWGNG